jgi:hypothetical protein
MPEARIERTAGATSTAVSLSETPAKKAKTEWRWEVCPSVLRPGHKL